jgi:hypothetical protein
LAAVAVEFAAKENITNPTLRSSATKATCGNSAAVVTDLSRRQLSFSFGTSISGGAPLTTTTTTLGASVRSPLNSNHILSIQSERLKTNIVQNSKPMPTSRQLLSYQF